MRQAASAALQAEAGHSLVEALVATALLVTVLVPLGAATVYLLTVRPNEPHRRALEIGHAVLEETLAAQAYVAETRTLDDGRWIVRRTIQHRGNQVTIRVRVFGRQRPAPLVELMTIRLLV